MPAHTGINDIHTFELNTTIELLLSSDFLVLTIILYLLGMHRATAAPAISQSLLTNRRSPYLLSTAGFPNHFNALILEDVLVDLHKYILPSYYVITCIRLFFTKHYWGLFAASRFREHCPCHTVQKNRVDSHPVSTVSLYRSTCWCLHSN